MLKNNYYLKARLFPSLLTSIPAIILYNTYLSPLLSSELASVFKLLPTITDVAISSALVFLMVQLNRLISKEIFQRFYFSDELKMPTTNYLMKSDDFFEESIKVKIETKINLAFGINLLSKKEEVENDMKARKMIATAVSQIRNSLRGNDLLLQHNIEYGFFRNLIGGSFLAFLLCILLMVLGIKYDEVGVKALYWILAFAYLIPIAFSRYIINRYGKYYAKILFEQFLTFKEN